MIIVFIFFLYNKMKVYINAFLFTQENSYIIGCFHHRHNLIFIMSRGTVRDVRAFAKSFLGFSEHWIPAGLNSSETLVQYDVCISSHTKRYNLFPSYDVSSSRPSSLRIHVWSDPITILRALRRIGGGGGRGKGGEEKNAQSFFARTERGANIKAE